MDYNNNKLSQVDNSPKAYKTFLEELQEKIDNSKKSLLNTQKISDDNESKLSDQKLMDSLTSDQKKRYINYTHSIKNVAIEEVEQKVITIEKTVKKELQSLNNAIITPEYIQDIQSALTKEWTQLTSLSEQVNKDIISKLMQSRLVQNIHVVLGQLNQIKLSSEELKHQYSLNESVFEKNKKLIKKQSEFYDAYVDYKIDNADIGFFSNFAYNEEALSNLALSDTQKELFKKMIESTLGVFSLRDSIEYAVNLDYDQATLNINLIDKLMNDEKKLHNTDDLKTLINYLSKLKLKFINEDQISALKIKLEEVNAKIEAVPKLLDLLGDYEYISIEIQNLIVLRRTMETFQAHIDRIQQMEKSENLELKKKMIADLEQYYKDESFLTTQQKEPFNHILKSLKVFATNDLRECVDDIKAVFKINLINLEKVINDGNKIFQWSTIEELLSNKQVVEDSSLEINNFNDFKLKNHFDKINALTKTQQIEEHTVGILNRYSSKIKLIKRLKDSLKEYWQYNKEILSIKKATNDRVNQIRASYQDHDFLIAEQKILFNRMFESIDRHLNKIMQNKSRENFQNKLNEANDEINKAEHILKALSKNKNLLNTRDNLQKLNEGFDSNYNRLNEHIIQTEAINNDLNNLFKQIPEISSIEIKKIDDSVELLTKYDTIITQIKRLKNDEATLVDLKKNYDESKIKFETIKEKIRINGGFDNTSNVKDIDFSPEEKLLYQLFNATHKLGSLQHKSLRTFDDDLERGLKNVSEKITSAENILREWSNSVSLPKDDHVDVLFKQVQLDATRTTNELNNLNELHKEVSQMFDKLDKVEDTLKLYDLLFTQKKNDVNIKDINGKHIRANILHHLLGAEGHRPFNQKGISGTHSKYHFERVMGINLDQDSSPLLTKVNNIEFEISKIETLRKGLLRVAYSTRLIDFNGNVIPDSERHNIKTLYDSKFFNDFHIAYYAVLAIKEAKLSTTSSPKYIADGSYTKEVDVGTIKYAVRFKPEQEKNTSYYVDSVYPIGLKEDSNLHVSQLVGKELAQFARNILESVEEVDAVKHQELIKKKIETDGDLFKTAFRDGYHKYKKIEIPEYKAHQDKSRSELLDLSHDGLSNQQLGALTRRINNAKNDFRSKLRKKQNEIHAHSYNTFEQHFSLSNEHFLDARFVSQHLLTQINKTDIQGYCYALSRAMAVAVANGNEKAARGFLNRLLKAVEQNGHNLGDSLTQWNNLANQQRAALKSKEGGVKLYSLDEIKHQLISSKETSVYELNTDKHAMMIGVKVGDNGRHYTFYDPEHGSISYHDADVLFNGLTSYFNNPERSNVYSISHDAELKKAQFELNRIDTNDIVKNAWAVDFSQGRFTHILQETDPTLQLIADIELMSHLQKSHNLIIDQFKKIDPRLAKDYTLIHKATERKSNGDIRVHFMHNSGDDNLKISLDTSYNTHAHLIQDVHKLHKGYKKLTLPTWFKWVDRVDDWSGYISIFNQLRLLITGALFHSDTPLEAKVLGYTQFGVGVIQAGVQLTVKTSDRLGKATHSVIKVAKWANHAIIVSKIGRILPMIGLVLEGASLGLSVRELVSVLNTEASGLQKGYVISNVAIGSVGFAISAATVTAMTLGAITAAGVLMGGGLLLIPISIGIGNIFEYYQKKDSAEQTYQYIGTITRSYQKGFEFKNGILRPEEGAVIKKIDLRGDQKRIYFGSQTVISQKIKIMGFHNPLPYSDGVQGNNLEERSVFADSVKNIPEIVTKLILPTTANQNLKYIYMEGDLNRDGLDIDGIKTINNLGQRGAANSYYNLGGSNTERESTVKVSLCGLQPQPVLNTTIDILLDKQVKQLYIPLIDKHSYNKITYNIEGEGSQYHCILTDKVKINLNEKEGLASIWILDSSNLIEEDHIRLETDKLIIGNVEINVSKLSPDSKMIIERPNGDVCIIDFLKQTKILTQITFQEYQTRKNNLFVNEGYVAPRKGAVLIKNYMHNGQQVGNAYLDVTKQQLLFSCPKQDYRPTSLVAVMNLMDKIMVAPIFYEIECSNQIGTELQATYGSGTSYEFINSGYSYELKERKNNDLLVLRSYIEQADFKASHSSLYKSMNEWLNDYQTYTQKIRDDVRAQSKKWESNVRVKTTSKTILNEKDFVKIPDVQPDAAINWIKVQQTNLQSVYKLLQQLNPLNDASLGPIVGEDCYFLNIQKGIAWRTNSKGDILEQYIMPLASTEWDYADLAFRQVQTPDGQQLFIDVTALSRRGAIPVVKSLTYQIGVNQMDLTMDYTHKSTHVHPSYFELGHSSFHFGDIPKANPKPSSSTHYYDETDVAKNYWILNNQRVYADLPNTVDIQAWQTMLIYEIPSLTNQLDIFYFYDSKNQKLYRQEGPGTTRDANNHQARLVSSEKITSVFLHKDSIAATTEEGITYKINQQGQFETKIQVTLDSKWLDDPAKKDWIQWLKENVLKDITNKKQRVQIKGLKGKNEGEQIDAWYQDGKLAVFDLGETGVLLTVDSTAKKAYILDSGKIYEQNAIQLSHLTDHFDGFLFKENLPKTMILADLTFSRVELFTQNKLYLVIKKQPDDLGKLVLFWDIKRQTINLVVNHPNDIRKHTSLLKYVDTIFFNTFNSDNYNLRDLIKENNRTKNMVIDHQYIQSNQHAKLQLSFTSEALFGRDLDDLCIIDNEIKIIIKNAFNLEQQETYKQLMLDISESSTFSISIYDLAQRLSEVEETSNVRNLYLLSNFIHAGLFISQAKGKNQDIVGSKNTNTLVGNELNNRIYGLPSDDILNGMAGNDKLYGEEGKDKLYGGDDQDKLYGGDDDDELYGENGNDILHGDQGNDKLDGGNGDDILYGHEGNDILYGGDGNDYYMLNEGDEKDVIDDANGIDVIYFSEDTLNNKYIFERLENDLIIHYGNDDQTIVGDHYDITKNKSIEGIEFQNGLLIDLANDSKWIWPLSLTATFKKHDHDLWIDDDEKTFILKNVFSVASLQTCTQLKISLPRGNYNFTFLAIDNILTYVQTILPTENIWYKWDDLFTNGALVFRENNQIVHAIAIQDNVTIVGDKFSNILYSKGGNSVLDGQQGNDQLYGSIGNDVYLFKNGDEEDVIYEKGGTDILALTQETEVKNLQRVGDDLIICYGYISSIRIKNHFKDAAFAVEHLKLSDDQTYDVADLVKVAEQLTTDVNSWTFSIGELIANLKSSEGVKNQNSDLIGNDSTQTADFSQHFAVGDKSQKTPAYDIDLWINLLEKNVCYTLNDSHKQHIKANVKHILGGLANEHLTGDSQSNKIYGGGGRDVFIGGKGNDELSDGTSMMKSEVSGDSIYQFERGDGHDSITDWGDSDVIRLLLDRKLALKKEINRRTRELDKVSFLKDNIDLIIKYNNDQDSIRIHSHFESGRGIEYLEWGANRFDLNSLTANRDNNWAQNFTLLDLQSYQV